MKRLLIAGAAVLALTSGAAHAATVVTETHVLHKPVPGPTVIDFRTFDTNRDGILTREEVGVKLFYTFDQDGNELIDNIEFERPMVMTFAPMERRTIQFVDYNSDGLADRTFTTQDVFLQQTGLSRFDPSGGGLSADKFIDTPFKKVDRDGSAQIDIREWHEAYNESLKPLPQNDTFRYNE